MMIRAALAIVALLFSAAAVAQDTGSAVDDSRFEIRLGGQLFSSFTSRLRVDSDTFGLGTELELESDLAVEEGIQVGRLDGVFNFNSRHALAMSFYDISRTGSRAIARDISYGDEFYPAGTPVGSEFGQQIIKAAYRYRFLDRPRWNLSGSIGLHMAKVETGLRALDGSIVQERDADAPLPVIGLEGTYAFADRWRLTGSLEWFDMQSGDLQGTLVDLLASIEHQTFENVSFGIGLNRFQFDFEAGDENLSGKIDLTFNAAVIYIKGSFGSIR
jgi:hypothetical protein